MSNEVIQIDVESEIQKIIAQLHSLPDQVAAPKVLKNALNAAARKVRKQMLQDVQKEYAVSKKKVLREESQGAPQLFDASTANLSAVIRSRGHMQDIMTFRTRRNTKDRPAKAQVLASRSLKDLEIHGLKAFLVTFASGHTAIVQRRGREALPLKKLLSPSVPHMLSNEAVRGPAEDKTYELLQAEIQRRIDKLNLG